jgi:hypothetical protein
VPGLSTGVDSTVVILSHRSLSARQRCPAARTGECSKWENIGSKAAVRHRDRGSVGDTETEEHLPAVAGVEQPVKVSPGTRLVGSRNAPSV